jgi:hypothetical protein
LYGIENITANNGWAMAVVGASIVFTGLVALSFVISQIHKLLELWEEREKYLKRFKRQVSIPDEEKTEAPAHKEQHVPSLDELAGTYEPLVEQLKEPFELSQLFEIAKNKDLPHPHLSIKRLREAEILVAHEDGTFTWNKERE